MQGETAPKRGVRGLWNCTTPEWPLLTLHLQCDLRVQCVEGQDEDGCGYTRCRHSGFRVKDKCYLLRSPNGEITWFQVIRVFNIQLGLEQTVIHVLMCLYPLHTRAQTQTQTHRHSAVLAQNILLSFLLLLLKASAAVVNLRKTMMLIAVMIIIINSIILGVNGYSSSY